MTAFTTALTPLLEKATGEDWYWVLHRADAALITASVRAIRWMHTEAGIEALASMLAERDVYEGYDKPTRAGLVEAATSRRLREVRSIVAAIAQAGTDPDA
jgi:hypothetical protein